MDQPFLVTDSPEPHTVRRRAILRAHPDVRDLFGPDPWMFPIVLGALAAHLVGAAAVVGLAFEPSWPRMAVVALLVTAIGPVLAHWCSMFIHEAAHDHVTGSPTADKLLAIVASVGLAVPAAMTFRKYHRRHHAWLGVRGMDGDLPLDVEARWIGTRPARKVLWYALFLVSYLARGWRLRSPPNRWELLNVAVVLAFDALIVALLGPGALLYLLACTLIGHTVQPVAAHFVHEHFLFVDGQETNSYYGPLNAFTFNVGYHVEHHDVPIIPGRRLPEYRRRTRAFYDDLAADRSWTVVMLRFAFAGDVGMASRVVRAHPVGGSPPPGRPFTPAPRLLVPPPGVRYRPPRDRALDRAVGDTYDVGGPRRRFG